MVVKSRENAFISAFCINLCLLFFLNLFIQVQNEDAGWQAPGNIVDMYKSCEVTYSLLFDLVLNLHSPVILRFSHFSDVIV